MLNHSFAAQAPQASILDSNYVAVRRLCNRDHPWRKRWDLAVMIVISLDFLMTPFLAARGPGVASGITIIYDVRWGIVDTVDELRRRYVRSWRFVVDAAACLPWEVVALTLGRGPNSLLFSQLRMSRVVRIYRVRETLQRWGLNIRINSNAVGIVNCVFFIVFASHFVACVWFWLAYTSSSTKRDVVQQSVESLLASEPNTWLDLVLDWQDMKTSLLYVKSLYWTMSTMTTVGYGAAKGRDVPNFSLGRVGYGDLTPVSTKEHWYAIFVMLFGSILFGYIFGLMASLVASMDVTMAAFRMKVDSVQRFLHYRNVPRERGACTATTTTRDMIISVPLFKNAEPAFVRAIVLRLLPTVFPENEKVVLKGEVGREMFFIQRGHCEVVNDETGEMLVAAKMKDLADERRKIIGARVCKVLNGKKRDDADKPETDEERRQRAEKRKLEQKFEEVSANTAKSSEAREEERTRIVGQTMVQAFKARRASTLAPVEEQKADVQASVMYAAPKPRRVGLERMSSKRRLSAAGGSVRAVNVAALRQAPKVAPDLVVEDSSDSDSGDDDDAPPPASPGSTGPTPAKRDLEA
ncbi:cyclic nucleotide-gated ion channel [Aureococcus anophagefferens]|nr:cyclic nucleotide-gated ion channel [Aureococcus anophagefferens]